MTKGETIRGRRRICPRCRRRVAQPATGRPRLYCSAACRQAAYRRRHAGEAYVRKLLRADVNAALGREREINAVVLKTLLGLGVVPRGMTREELAQAALAAEEVVTLERKYRSTTAEGGPL